jgi:hypothetical protein
MLSRAFSPQNLYRSRVSRAHRSGSARVNVFAEFVLSEISTTDFEEMGKMAHYDRSGSSIDQRDLRLYYYSLISH